MNYCNFSIKTIPNRLNINCENISLLQKSNNLNSNALSKIHPIINSTYRHNLLSRHINDAFKWFNILICYNIKFLVTMI